MPPRLNIPPVTRILLLVLLLQSVLSAAIRYRQWSANSEIVIPYLTLIPQLSLVYPWTFVTTTLVESNVFTLGIAATTIFQGGRYLERAWSSAEFAKFLLVVSLVPNVLTFCFLILLFSLTRDERWTLTTVAGTIPLQIGFLVGFSQLVPAHTVTLFRGILSLRVPRLPLLYVGLVAILAMTPLLTTASLSLAVSGFFSAWTYLRFYKSVFPDLDSSQSAGLRGDPSETFALAEFFPGPAKPAVAALSARVFDVLVAVRLCTPFSPDHLAAGRAGEGGPSGGGFGQRGAPGSARAEAERRRALALKALDQRLHAASASAAAARGGSTSSAGAASSASASAPAAASSAPPPTGPTVQAQPAAGGQAGMTAPAAVLGETNYNPDEGTGIGDKSGP